MKVHVVKIAFIGVGILCMGIGLIANGNPAEQRSGLKAFMRQKLDHSQNILEGLTRENYPQIAKHAQALRELSEDAQWRVSPNIAYIRMSTEFQELTGELASKARERNLDGSTLAFVKITMKCIECHKLVRDQHLTMNSDDQK